MEMQRCQQSIADALSGTRSLWALQGNLSYHRCVGCWPTFWCGVLAWWPSNILIMHLPRGSRRGLLFGTKINSSALPCAENRAEYGVRNVLVVFAPAHFPPLCGSRSAPVSRIAAACCMPSLVHLAPLLRRFCCPVFILQHRQIRFHESITLAGVGRRAKGSHTLSQQQHIVSVRTCVRACVLSTCCQQL
jgi:hypothetical protein